MSKKTPRANPPSPSPDLTNLNSDPGLACLGYAKGDFDGKQKALQKQAEQSTERQRLHQALERVHEFRAEKMEDALSLMASRLADLGRFLREEHPGILDR